MKIAIGFFGIIRSLKYTIKSIEENIFDVFKSNNIEYDIFMHTYCLSTPYRNIRTKEYVEHVDNDEYKLMNANFIEIDNQDEIKSKIYMKAYRTRKDPWHSGYNSVDNFILGQYSKQKMTNMIEREQEKENKKYDYILFMRPDCLYVDKFDINFFNSINDCTISIPNFHLFGVYNFNDRFCIANSTTYKIYGEVFDQLLQISKQQTLHSETVLGKIMSDNKLKINRIPFRFSRVRANGEIINELVDGIRHKKK